MSVLSILDRCIEPFPSFHPRLALISPLKMPREPMRRSVLWSDQDIGVAWILCLQVLALYGD